MRGNKGIIKKTGIILLFILTFNILSLSHEIIKESLEKVVVENTDFNGYETWEENVEQYALMHMNEKLEGVFYSTEIGEMIDGTTIVKFIDEKGKMEAEIALMRKKDRQWQVLWENINNAI